MPHLIFRFLFGNLILSLLIVAVLLVKRGFRKHMTMGTQYSVSRLFLLVLALPFLPTHLIQLPRYLNWFRRFSIADADGPGMAAVQTAAADAAAHTNWMQDFAVAADGSGAGIPALALTALWIAGIAAILLLTIRGNQRLRTIKRLMIPITDESVLTLYQDAAGLAGYGRRIELGECDGLKTPITFGLFRPYIVIPGGLRLADEAMKCVFLHELLHRRHMDVIVNYVMCLCRILYWFNPFVWILLREMRTEREVVCDASVLKLLEQDQYYDYGKTILCFASDKIKPFILAPEMSGSKRQVKKRIQEIVSFKTASRAKKVKSSLIFLVICLLVIGSLPAFTVFAQGDTVNGDLILHENAD